MATKSADPQEKIEPVVLGLYHVNINCSNLDQSIAFYEMLGFRVAEKFEQAGETSLDHGLGLEYSHAKAAFMAIGRNRFETVLDLCQWILPEQVSQVPVITGIGMPRIALRVKNLDAQVEKLEAHGVKFLSEPKRLEFLARKPRFCCFKDPDGIFIELVEL